MYGTAGFDAGQTGGGQQYWGGQTSNMNPEELFRKIFGEFSGGRGFGDFNAMFDQPQEVCNCETTCCQVVSLYPCVEIWPALTHSSVSAFHPVHDGADVHSGSKGDQQGDVYQH